MDSTTITAAMVRAACMEVAELPSVERYNRVGAILRRVRTFAPSFAVAVSGFQSFGPDAVTFRRLA